MIGDERTRGLAGSSESMAPGRVSHRCAQWAAWATGAHEQGMRARVRAQDMCAKMRRRAGVALAGMRTPLGAQTAREGWMAYPAPSDILRLCRLAACGRRVRPRLTCLRSRRVGPVASGSRAEAGTRVLQGPEQKAHDARRCTRAPEHQSARAPGASAQEQHPTPTEPSPAPRRHRQRAGARAISYVAAVVTRRRGKHPRVLLGARRSGGGTVSGQRAAIDARGWVREAWGIQWVLLSGGRQGRADQADILWAGAASSVFRPAAPQLRGARALRLPRGMSAGRPHGTAR